MIDLAQDQASDAAASAAATSLQENIVSDQDKVVEQTAQDGNFEVHELVAAPAGTEPEQAMFARIGGPTESPETEITTSHADTIPEGSYLVQTSDVDTAVAAGAEQPAAEEAAAPTEKPLVDLSRLEHFNEHRSANPQGNAKKRKPAMQAQGQQKSKPAPQRPALLQSEKSQSYLRDAMRPQGTVNDVDGVSHINTSSSAVTDLGKALEINARVPFKHPDLGPFNSVGGLWYFVGDTTPDEQFRTLHGRAVRNRGSNVNMRKVKGFKTIIAEATWIKIRSNEKLSKDMADNILPYRCYYSVGELALPQSTAIAEWYMPVLEEIGRALKAIYIDGQPDAFPNFEFLERSPQQERRKRPVHNRY